MSEVNCKIDIDDGLIFVFDRLTSQLKVPGYDTESHGESQRFTEKR